MQTAELGLHLNQVLLDVQAVHRCIRPAAYRADFEGIQDSGDTLAAGPVDMEEAVGCRHQPLLVPD